MSPLRMAMPLALEEKFDALVCRPLARIVAERFFLKTSITANQVSGLAALFGIWAGLGAVLPGSGPAWGALALFGMMVLDCADGEVARARGGGGWRGRAVDGLADLVTAFSVHLGMLLHQNSVGGEVFGVALTPGVNFFIALGAGVSMSWRCGVVDDVKQRLKSSSVDSALADHAGDVKGWWDRFLFWTLSRYVESIRRYSGKRRPGGATLFRRAQWVGPTHHHLAMVVALLLVGRWPNAYLIFLGISLIPANLYLVVVLWLAPAQEGQSASELVV